MSWHREDYQAWLSRATTWVEGHGQLVLYAAIALIAFTAGAYACFGKAATINIPECDTLTVTAQTPALVTLGCGHTPVQPPPPSGNPYAACNAAGYTPQAIAIAWPAHGNISGGIPPRFGNTDALVISFTTPASGKAVFQPAGMAPTQNTSRTYTLATVPCQFSGGYTITSQSPAIGMTVGTCPYSNPVLCQVYGPYVAPSTTYYVTMVNRSCVSNCPMRLDFNHAAP